MTDRPTSAVSFWRLDQHRHPVSAHLLPLPPAEDASHPHRRSGPNVGARALATYARMGDRVLEVCCGWATFSSLAAFEGYAGDACDIWPVAVEFCSRQLAAIPGSRFGVFRADARATGRPSASYDLVYSHLPLPARRGYGDPADLALGTRARWRANMLGVLTEAARVLRPGGLVVVACGDQRDDGDLVPLHADLISEPMLEASGLLLHDLVCYETLTRSRMYQAQHAAKRRTAKTHEYLLVYRTPAPTHPRARATTTEDRP